MVVESVILVKVQWVTITVSLSLKQSAPPSRPYWAFIFLKMHRVTNIVVVVVVRESKLSEGKIISWQYVVQVKVVQWKMRCWRCGEDGELGGKYAREPDDNIPDECAEGLSDLRLDRSADLRLDFFRSESRPTRSNGVIRADGMTHSAFNSADDHPAKKEPTKENKSREGDVEYAEVMACSGDFAISAARMDSTLYSMIHKEHREIGKRGIEMQIVNGLKHVVAHRGWSDVLTRLSSHWILVDTAGNVQLKLEMSSTEADAEAARQRQKARQQPNLEGNENELARGEDENTRGKCEGDKSGMDGLRWRAPEVVAAEERSGVESVDGHKASVFSLGLVLWEIETGQVPFGELDAVNAQRQSGTGIGPKMESLRDELLISLIRRCVSVDPKERPTLTEIGEFLSSHPEDTRIPSGHEMKE
ncbi:hypothetical protein BLNAU_9342 [Blattamonas nauphoetae]|uniref:Protein kinase domain-containing protein n=1 Tax=Blattamonas nauphoetae TaxID=2049346 RepID=A0ABQ9XVY9_9EUKA|nr:hypothetical protein BLNAU_9342 [Blattamonas nauphoetae]